MNGITTNGRQEQGSTSLNELSTAESMPMRNILTKNLLTQHIESYGTTNGRLRTFGNQLSRFAEIIWLATIREEDSVADQHQQLNIRLNAHNTSKLVVISDNLKKIQSFQLSTNCNKCKYYQKNI